MNNIVFLDIDGVVNTLQISDKPFDTSRGGIERNGFYFLLCHEGDEQVSNKQAIMWLNKLCLETKSKIVISSTWRFSGLENCKKALYNSGLDKRIEIIDITSIDYARLRGIEIKNWLKYHKDIKNYVILDDDNDMGDLSDHLVLCNNHYGFNYPEYISAIDILKK